MSKIIPISHILKHVPKGTPLKGASIVVDNEGIPAGFVFGRDSFITFLETMDEAIEKAASDPKKASNNPAGNLIDLIEEHLQVSAKFASELQTSVQTKNQKWIPFEEVVNALHV